jgi:hypothetical protein
MYRIGFSQITKITEISFHKANYQLLDNESASIDKNFRGASKEHAQQL